ncbi:DUF6164 family protein [Hydrocarboniclastica marina]|uniref:DUF2007 domain-containing protein n=1 Tax=Hydrocarboniclastica marina TaxID=2259620 RepID=A0A4P7XJN2_9ALTE|nr:DUF6164 family protein [Hydrocarboniclastica marina]QCF26983.1 hypothetical protein soil367_14165 [Hydrocarboniclastica marina]
MPELLFKLRNVPDDEAQEVRAILDEHGIRYYETSEGNWKIAVPALWLADTSQLAQARELVAAYQAARFRRAREEHEQAIIEGKAPTLWSLVRRNPWRALLYVAGVAVILYLSVMPFIGLGG